MNSLFSFKTIDHVTLIVADLEKTRRFYCDVLGMKQVERPDFNFEGMWISHSDSNGANDRALIHVTLQSELAGQAGWGDRSVGRLSRGHHFAFEIGDAKLACEYLKQQGIPIAVGPNHRPDGPTQFFIKDPDGHLIEFFSVS